LATSCVLAPSPSPVDREEDQKEKSKLGWDKNTSTEQQREKITTIILIKRIYSMQCSHHLKLSLLLSSKSPYCTQLPQVNTEHGITQYRISHLSGCLGQPNKLILKSNPIPAEPRTENYLCQVQRHTGKNNLNNKMVLFGFKSRKICLMLGKIHKCLWVFQRSDALDSL